MDERRQEGSTILALMALMNTLHRLAVDTKDRCPQSKLTEGMTVPQLAVITCLSLCRERAIYQRDLEAIFHLRRSSISSILGVLERKGILAREAVAHDARLKKLVLTPQGEVIGEMVRGLFSEMDRQLTQGVSQEDLDATLATLRAMQNNLEPA
jgi:DNA-binding MarR family transcriptional regulator